MEWQGPTNLILNYSGNLQQSTQEIPAVNLTDPAVVVTTWTDISELVLIIGIACIIGGYIAGRYYASKK